MFLIVGVDDVEGIAIGNLNDLAGEGIGEGRYAEKYEGAKSNTKKTDAISRGAMS